MSFGARIVRTLMRLLGKLPLGFHLFCGKVISVFLRSVVRYRRDVATVNVSRSFPDRKYKEIKEIVNKSYDQIGRIFGEAIWFGGSDAKRVRQQKIATLQGWDLVEDAFQNTPSVMILDTHRGNWEITGGVIEFKGTPSVVPADKVRVVYKKMSSRFWEEVIADNRCAIFPTHDNIVESSDVLRYALSHRDDHMIYVFPTDQYPYKNASPQLVKDFMHQKTVSMTGGAALARLLHMSVFIMDMRVESRSTYTIKFEKLCNDASDYDPVEIMDMYYEKLQGYLEDQPWNYLWTHKRWKNKPEDMIQKPARKNRRPVGESELDKAAPRANEPAVIAEDK